MNKPLWMWALFVGVVLFLLVLDLGIMHRKAREISIKESLYMSAFYIAIALLFAGWIWYSLGITSASEYTTGFLVEKSLTLDNIFLIAMIFSYFKIPPNLQHRVLFWGVLGVLILRAIMIGLGASLVAEFSWVLDIFAVFLIITGIKMFLVMDKPVDIGKNRILLWMYQYLPISSDFHGDQFLVKLPNQKTGKLRWFLTPLMVALILVEIIDLIFAVDSIPAIFTITNDPYIVYTSNIFAILGVRALYFALSAVLARFKYLKYSLATVLIFIGSKNFIADILGLIKFPAVLSLTITFAILAIGIIYSIYKTAKK